MYGSDDLFPDSRAEAYHAYQSVNYVTSHDGFTLYDLVCYNRKHNWKNGNNNQDDTDANYSWNCGQEGDEALSPRSARCAGRKLRISVACSSCLTVRRCFGPETSS
jgi:isoamylase